MRDFVKLFGVLPYRKFFRAKEIFSLVCEIPKSFERASPSNCRKQGSFIHINSGKIFERDLLSSDTGTALQNLQRKNLGFSEIELRS